MPTETITLQYGPIGGLTSSTFSWTITNVATYGTFVDGSPWVVVGSGAELIDIEPKSILKTTTSTNSRYTVAGITCYINGSAKNIKSRFYTTPNFTINDLGARGTTGTGKFPLDGRVCYPASGQGTQQNINLDYDATANIGVTVSGNSIAPVGLTYGDVIVTANSVWYLGPTAETTLGLTALYGNFSVQIPNAPQNWRTGIKELGVLTVLQQGLTQACFRPPFQWIDGSSQTRPAPIPLSSVNTGSTGESILFHNTTFATNLSNTLTNVDRYLRSPAFHDGHDVEGQSSSSNFAYYSGDGSSFRNAWTYVSTHSLPNSLMPMLIKAFNTANSNRVLARNRLLQYGIDCYGAFMSMTDIYGTAGHRGSEIKPWILMSGWLLRNASMLNVLSSFRAQYAGTTYASLTDEQICERKFAEDAVVFKIEQSDQCGSYLRQTFAPSTDYYVIRAQNQNSTTFYSGTDGITGQTKISGKYAKFVVNSLNHYGYEADDQFLKSYNYLASYVKVTSGAGSGDTLYRIIEATPIVTPTEFTLDRPWINGIPDSTSTIEIFAVRDGNNGVIGSTADVGRYVYSGLGIEFTDSVRDRKKPNLSPRGYNYASQFLTCLPPHVLFKTISEETGITAFYIGKTWKYISEFVNGSCRFALNETLNTNEINGNCPDGQNISNLIWQGSLGGGGINYTNAVVPIWNQWLGLSDDVTSFGYQHFDRIPGYELEYNATSTANVLVNFGATGGGGSDINGDGVTDSADLAFILANWGN